MHYAEIKTVEDAFRYKGIDPDFKPDFSYYPDKYMQEYKLSEFKLEMVVSAINGGWVADWSNTKQKKWYVFFSISSSGFGFSFTVYYCEYSSTIVGSRLVFESEEKAAYAAKIFIKLYEELYGLNSLIVKPNYREIVEKKISEFVSDEQYKAIYDIIK